MIEIYATCELFYHLSGKKKLFAKKFKDSNKYFNEDKW